MTEAMFMLTLHSANIFNRRLSDWELTEGVAEFKKYLVAAREAGEVVITGKMRIKNRREVSSVRYLAGSHVLL